MVRCWQQALAALAVLLGSASVAHATDPKITLTESMVVNEMAAGNPAALVDEQSTAGDPANGSGGAPSNGWTNSLGYSATNFPAYTYLDLGATYNITTLSLYDTNGSGTITFSSGTPFNWTQQTTDGLNTYNHWTNKAVNFTTRFLRVQLAGPGYGMPELVLYGTLVSTPTPTPTPSVTPTPRPPALMDQFIGTNAFFDDPTDKIAAVGFVREYHNWTWDEGATLTYPDNPKAFNPTYAGFRFDEFYTRLKNAGLVTSPCLQKSALSLVGGDSNKLDNKPVPVGSDPLLPASYAMHADHMYQLAARYGGTSVPDANLKLADGQPRSTNTKLLNYFENWNEPDKTWKGRDGYFTPYELATMCSADYDGHQGSLGSTFGVKNADPSAKMVMGGLAFPSMTYLTAMKVWADYNRGGSFPADVINIHTYSNAGGGQTSQTVGISPEDDNLKSRMAAFVQWRNQNVPNAEVWVSEFGYDVNQSSVQRAPAIGATSGEEVQGQWITRSFLAMAAAGVDKAMQYMLRDVDAASTTKYDSSGLVTKKGEWTPRASWYYVSTLKNRLKGLYFDAEVASGNPNVWIYRFRNANNSKTAYAVWCPTSNNTTVSNYLLTVGSNVTAATQVVLTSGDTDGVDTALTPNAQHKVTLPTVSERPLLVLTDNSVWQQCTTTITSPTENDVFGAPASLTIDAMVANNTLAVTKVDFYKDGVNIGNDTTAPYSLSVSGWAVGSYSLTARATLSNNALYTSAPVRIIVNGGTGLKGQYFNGSNFDTLLWTRTDPTVNFDWGWNSGAGPGGSITYSAFSVRWTGKIQARESGTYQFQARYDDAVRIWINDGTTNRLILDRWTTGASTFYAHSGTVYLQAGQRYDIQIDYAQRGSGSQIKVEWLRPGQTATEILPTAYLYPAP